MKFDQALLYFKRRRNKAKLVEEECAIAALEKQIPKKIEILGSTDSILGMREYCCPHCGQLMAKLYDFPNYLRAKGMFTISRFMCA